MGGGERKGERCQGHLWGRMLERSDTKCRPRRSDLFILSFSSCSSSNPTSFRDLNGPKLVFGSPTL